MEIRNIIANVGDLVTKTEYWEVFWKSELTCCHLDSSERSKDNAGVKKKKNSQRVIIRFASIESLVDATIREFEYFIKKSREIWGTTAINSNDNIRTNETMKTRKQKWEEKQLYGYFKWQTSKSPTRRSGHGYEKETLREKLNFWIAAQNGAIKINYIKGKMEIRNIIANVGDLVTKTKWLITL